MGEYTFFFNTKIEKMTISNFLLTITQTMKPQKNVCQKFEHLLSSLPRQ